MSRRTDILLAAVALIGPHATAFAKDISVPIARVAVIDEIDVPARSEGSLVALSVREGMAVTAGQEVGRVDDAAARLTVARAKALVAVARKQAAADAAVELAKRTHLEARAAVRRAELKAALAERTAKNLLGIRAAESALARAKADVEQWSVEVEIAEREAESRVDERIAQKTATAAEEELNRAIAARRSVGDAISLSEIEELTLVRDKAQLEVDRAVEVREVAGLTKDLKAATREASRADVATATVGVEQARFERAMNEQAVELEKAALTAAELAEGTAAAKVKKAMQDADLIATQLAVAESDLAIATEAWERHAVVSPVAGMVVERYRNRGEWVKPGENVLRIFRLDRLRAEAYVPEDRVDTSTVGSPVLITVSTRGGLKRLPGRVVHVGSEIDTLKKQVLVWAEFDNPGLAVRPGGKCSLVIREGGRSE